MIVDLTRLDAAPIEFDLSIKPSEIDFEGDYAKAKNGVRFKGNLISRDNWITVGGEVFAELEIACGRCLGIG